MAGFLSTLKRLGVTPEAIAALVRGNNKGVTTGVPSAPVITIAVVIEPGRQPLVMDVKEVSAGVYRCTLVNVPRTIRVAGSRCSASEG